jgi:hypothetical protein
MVRYRVQLLWLMSVTGVLLIAADASWKTRPTSQWTEEDARQILTRSPWARQVIAGIARYQTEDELRDGGRMGQPQGIGYEGVDKKGSGPTLPTSPNSIFTGAGATRSARSMVQSMTVMLRWESALPIRLAELKSREMDLPTLEGDGYRIAVYGLPGGNFRGDPKKLGDPLKEEAFLKREGKKDVKPTIVEVFPRSDGWVVTYLFPLSAEISPKDGLLQFEAHIGRIVVTQSFALPEMQFQGKLEL